MDISASHNLPAISWKSLSFTVKLLSGSFIFFIGLVLFFLFLILSLRIKKSLNAKKAAIAAKIFEDFVMDIIFNDEMQGTNEIFSADQLDLIINFKNDYLKDSFSRDVILGYLLKLHKNLSGETADRLRELYLVFQFDKDSMKRLNNNKWYIKAKAINELEQMQIRKAYSQIYRCANHSNQILRSVSQMAIVSLKKTNQLSFLFNLSEELTEWEQMNLLGRLVTVKNLKTSEIPRLLGSHNESVVLLDIKIIKHLNLIEYEDRLPELLNSSSEKIRIEVIKCLSFLHVSEARNLLIRDYDAETHYVKIEILNAIQSLGIAGDSGWLGACVESGDLEIANAARMAIMKLPS